MSQLTYDPGTKENVENGSVGDIQSWDLEPLCHGMWGLWNLVDMLSAAKPPTADVRKVESCWGEAREGGMKQCKAAQGATWKTKVYSEEE